MTPKKWEPVLDKIMRKQNDCGQIVIQLDPIVP
jgi:hypothetical protein